ncbi:MAG: glutamyl-tRNA reductase [uncultured archaeon A07HR60]|nr:MAG: glutamyl-tRNA reductase [uncultured archaeon A07HR60]
MRDTGVITGVSVAHGHATVDEIEAAGRDSTQGVVSNLLAREGVEEAFSLITCNRAEAYVVTPDAAAGRQALETVTRDVRDGAIRRLDHEESLRHLMRVAAGLESLVLGEDQILGQVRTAYEEARAAGGIGRVLEDSVTKAIHVGSRARTETTINQGTLSLGAAAVELAAQRADLDGGCAVVVGAGEMGTLAARALDSAAIGELVIANRTLDRADHVATELDTDTTTVPLAELTGVMANSDADVMVSATGSPDPVVSQADLTPAEGLVCVDVAQPRDIDPAADGVDGVTVYNLDDLESVTSETRRRRAEAATQVESIIDDEFQRILTEFKRNRADAAISKMYEGAEHTKRRQLDTALEKLEAQGGLTDEQRETVESLADTLVGRLLAAPTKSLRDAAGEDDWNTIQTALELFNPEFDAPPQGSGPPSDAESETGDSTGGFAQN